MANQTLQYYMHDGPSSFRIELAGVLDREGARRLEQDWQTASSVIGDRSLIVDMTFVTRLDEDAKALLARWHRDGAQIVAKSTLAAQLAEKAIGEALAAPHCVAQPVDEGTWRPFRTSLSMIRRIASRVTGAESPTKPEIIGGPSTVGRKTPLQS